eukprot:12973109-Ditylum_brightwellii.AAC.1
MEFRQYLRSFTVPYALYLDEGAAANTTNSGICGGILELRADCSLASLTAATLLCQQHEL